jgi:hypothetical protein
MTWYVSRFQSYGRSSALPSSWRFFTSCPGGMGGHGTRAESLNLIVPAIGTLTGNGTIASNGTLDVKMLAKLNNSNVVARGVSRYTSLGHPENGIPFRIAGTTANPVFMPDVSGIVDNVVKHHEENAADRSTL